MSDSISSGRLRASPEDEDDVSLEFSRAFEEAVLFGRPQDIDALMARARDDDEPVTDDLLLGLDALRWFRAHYGERTAHLSEPARQTVIRYDADWAMGLIRMLHPDLFGAAVRTAS